jgi:hypothetical protein
MWQAAGVTVLSCVSPQVCVPVCAYVWLWLSLRGKLWIYVFVCDSLCRCDHVLLCMGCDIVCVCVCHSDHMSVDTAALECSCVTMPICFCRYRFVWVIVARMTLCGMLPYVTVWPSLLVLTWCVACVTWQPCVCVWLGKNLYVRLWAWFWDIVIDCESQKDESCLPKFTVSGRTRTQTQAVWL